MARRSTSMLDDLMDIAETFPWWVGTLMAIGSYFFFHWLSFIEISTSNNSSDLVAVLWTYSIKFLATVFQYLFPLALGLGALVSGVKQWKRHKIYEKQTSIHSIRELGWKEFEELISEAFRRQGYQVVETDDGPDGGIDLILRRDGKKILAQCKHWKKWKVGANVVRELNGVVAAKGAYSGILVTSGVFTTGAINFSETCPIELIDGERLAQLIPQIEPHAVSEQNNNEIVPSCPACGGEMVKRLAKKGMRVGKQFWGCSTFPKCRGIINIDN